MARELEHPVGYLEHAARNGRDRVLALNLPDQIQANQRRARSMIGAFSVLIFVVSAVVFGLVLGLVGLVPAIVLAAGVTFAVARGADAAVRRGIGGVPADPSLHGRLHNLVEGLCAGAGLTKPALVVVEDPAPNACAFGRDPRRATLVVTRGLLEKLSRIELEGVVAHELSHIKNHDIVPSTTAFALLGRVAPTRVASLVDERREGIADVTGVALTRYPPGLISALEKLRDDAEAFRSPHPALAHLWIEAPIATPSHPPLEERISALREL